MRILHILDHSIPLHSGYSFRSYWFAVPSGALQNRVKTLGEWFFPNKTDEKRARVGRGTLRPANKFAEVV